MLLTQLRQLLPFLKPYWRRAGVALLLLTTLVGLDLALPRLIQYLLDAGVARGDLPVVVQTALLMLGLSLVSLLIAVGNSVLSVQVGENVARDLREALFLKIQALAYGDIDRFTTGNLLVRLTSDTGAVQRWVQISLRIGTRAPLLMLGSLILMVNTNPQLALTLTPLLVVTGLIIVFFSLKLEPLFRGAQQKLDRLNTVLQENLAGARLVKAFVRAEHETARFEAANTDFTTRTIQTMQFMSTMGPVLTGMVNLGLVLVVWAGGLEVIRGALTLGQIVAFTNYLLTTMGPLTMMTQLANVWANGLASQRRIQEVLATVPEIQPAPDAQPWPAAPRGQVEFQHVTFYYRGGEDQPVLEDVSLTARPGQRVALLGATGAGKTSLINLIPRFYDAAAGRVLIDGRDVRALPPEALLAHIAVVPQETILFSGSVRDNIRYGRPAADEAEVVAAAKAAQAHDFILNLPQGYDTRVEERGVNLSGGQKQRLAIARALLTHPRILILDDSTSAVDVETETRLQAALDDWLAGCTVFVVAQRVSTVLTADQIVVLDKGRVAARGTHAELLQTSPIYQEIYDSQLGAGQRFARAAAGGAP